uniref:RecQ-mediated genome instability protein 1 n=1 Tax=Saccoglossus kowalevskii TaxID=10224 RepID=A0ABM0M9M6_SACKO|nr:PREDICTED: recQ-mediated genome instability protein 1-like [Saccoglossus kowalevskii]
MVTTVSCLAWLKSTYCIHASFEWCEACIEWIKDEYQNSPLSPRKVHELVFEQWLHADLKDIGEPCLPDGLRTQEQAHLTGVHSLQVESLRDVSTPAYSQLQKLSGKDDPEDLISTATQPTQRIQICGNVQCRLGVLMLMASNVKVLGGEVESLQEENSQQLVLSRAIGVEAQALPPQITAGNTTDNVEENMTLHSTNDTTRHAGHTASFQSSEPTITGQHHHNRQNMQSGLLQSDNQTCLNSGLVISQHSRHQAVRETTHTQQTHPQPSMTEEEAWMEEEMDVDDDDILDEELLQQLDQIEQREFRYM